MRLRISPLQKLILAVYIFFNTYSLIYLLVKRITFGDFFLPAENTGLIFLSYFAILIPFITFGYIVFPLLEYRLAAHQPLSNSRHETWSGMSIFVLLLQISFLLFNVATGANKVGAQIHVSSPVKYLFILFQPDTFFLIIYGCARKNRFFKYNLLIYCISSIQMGWMGGISLIFLLEIFEFSNNERVKRDRKKLIFSVIIFSVALLLAFPFVMILRSRMRGQDLLSILGHPDYFGLLSFSLNYLFGRMQHLSSVYLAFVNYDQLASARANGTMVSCFGIGLPQQLIYKFLGKDYVTVFGTLYDIITNDGAKNSWTHVGWIGLILPEIAWLPVFIVYTSLLIYFSIFFAREIGGRRLQFVLWLYLVIYFLHGWIQNYIGLLQSLFLFWLLQRFAISSKNIRLLSRVKEVSH